MLPILISPLSEAHCRSLWQAMHTPLVPTCPGAKTTVHNCLAGSLECAWWQARQALFSISTGWVGQGFLDMLWSCGPLRKADLSAWHWRHKALVVALVLSRNNEGDWLESAWGSWQEAQLTNPPGTIWAAALNNGKATVAGLG